MRKWIRSVIVLLGTALVLTGAAAAVSDEVPTLSPVLHSIEEDFPQTFAVQEWPADAECYADLLEGRAAQSFEQIKTAFTPYEKTEFVEKTFEFSDGSTKSGLWGVVHGADSIKVQRNQDGNAKVQEWWIEADAVLEQSARTYYYDAPECFWRGTNYVFDAVVESDQKYIYATASIYYLVGEGMENAALRAELNTRIEAQVEALTAEVEDLPDLEKLAYWDQWLAANNDYNKAAANSDPHQDMTPWSVVSGLLAEYTPVCEGYAHAFQLLCRASEIPCVVQSGSKHMWNAVRLDGEWYVIDPTHNDPVINSAGDTRDYSSREYFLVKERAAYRPNMLLCTPKITKSDYFGAWTMGNEAIRGGEVFDCENAPMLWFACYNASGRLIEMKPAQKIGWTPYTDLYTAPLLTDEELGAMRIELFCLQADGTFAPYRQNTTIK